MFTGLVAELGSIAAVDATADGVRVTLATTQARELREGDSISVDGVCVTATAIDAQHFAADVMHETLRRSTLGELQPGAPVNLEFALRAADRLGGHIMQGHVDGVATIAAVREDGFARVLTVVPADRALLRYVVHKGSVAVSGVSLTVARVDDEGFDVALIPETLERTTLGGVVPETRVNLEVDVVAKYVEKLLPGGAAGLAS
ncbi:MAG TPA: riboflavin synthase [Solirubrobacteraceae bacterium]|nr:riboflavin synthase [Solirubrobacteraceae bacterium]